MNNPELLIGLVAIAVTIFLGLASIAVAAFFGLKEFRKGIMSELSIIKEAVLAIRGTVEKTWDLALRQSGAGGGTVERELKNLGKVRITAEPGAKETSYLIEIEKPVFHEALLFKTYAEKGLIDKEKEIFGKELHIEIIVFSPTRLRFYLPCTEPKLCTQYMTIVLQWLNSTYVDSLGKIKEFEESILT